MLYCYIHSTEKYEVLQQYSGKYAGQQPHRNPNIILAKSNKWYNTAQLKYVSKKYLESSNTQFPTSWKENREKGVEKKPK